MSNNAAERALRGIAVGRRNWTFAGSDRGGERAAAIYTLIETAKLNGVDPQAWLADVLARIARPSRQADRRPPAVELARRHGRFGRGGCLMSPAATGPSFTPKQGQYLAFIYAYTRVLGRPPAEADLQRHFGVSPPAVHQMVLTLERVGLIRRQPGAARSIEVLVAPEMLPVLR